jgi:multidrug resistance efflux pump
LRAWAAFLCVAASFLLVSCDREDDAVAADVPKVEIRAQVASAQTAMAIATVDGRVATIDVAEGASVQPGQVVATLTNASVDRDLAHARAQVALAEQRLRDARKPIATSLILGDSGARERASAEILKNRETKRDRYRELFKTRDVSKEELENAENEYAAALRDYLAERERASIKVVQPDTSLLQLELEKAKAEEAFVAERKSLLRVVAPIGGVVTRVHARAGESIFTRDPVVEIQNDATVDVRGTIAPELVRYVRAGMPVEVKVFTVPPRKFNVPVKAVVPGPAGATLVVDLPNPDAVLQAGQQAMITVSNGPR